MLEIKYSGFCLWDRKYQYSSLPTPIIEISKLRPYRWFVQGHIANEKIRIDAQISCIWSPLAFIQQAFIECFFCTGQS